MRKSKKYTVKYRRKRERKTDYKARLRLAKSGLPRLVVKPLINSFSAQIIEFSPKGDKVLASANSSELKKLGYKLHCGNIPSAYLTGLLIGKKAINKGIKKAILDIGFAPSIKNSRVYSALKGAIDAGLNVPSSDSIYPKEEILNGSKIQKYAESLSNDQEKYKKQFSNYLKNNVDPKKISQHIEDIKKKVLSNEER